MGINTKICAIVGASPAANIAFIQTALQKADFIICADGGWDYVHAAGKQPQLMIGDFDSAEIALPEQVEVVTLPTNKDDTDLLAAVKEGLKRGYTQFLLLGALGGRTDHTYGNLCVLQYIAGQGGTAVLQSENTAVYLLLPDQTLQLSGVRGKTVSVFPFGCERCTLTYTGLEYPLQQGTLVSYVPLGVSNVAQQEDISIVCHSGTAVIMALDLEQK